MKKLIIITGIICAFYLLLITAVAPQAQAPTAAAVKTAESAVQSGYTVGVSEDRVAVFHNGELYMRTDTAVSSLPKSDQKRLREGVYVNSMKELKSLLQDYCS